MIVQLCFNSDRAPFSKVALALCALMMNYEVLDVLLNYNNLNAPFSLLLLNHFRAQIAQLCRQRCLVLEIME